MKKQLVYALADPLSGEIRYIGKTSDLSKRYSYHANGHSKAYVGNWIKSLLSKKLLPDMLVLCDNLTKEQASFLEQCYIAYGREVGWRLTNLTDGGEGMPNPSQSVRDIISQKSKAMWEKRKAEGWKHSEKAKEKISKANSGRIRPKEAIQKAVESRKGYRHSAETIAKIRYSNQNNGFKMPREIVERLAKQKRGTTRSKQANSKTSQSLKEYYKNNSKPETSQETRKKISESKKGNSPAWNKGKSLTEKAKQHLSEINKGKKHTEETKQKIAKSSKGKFQTYSEEKQKEIGAKIAESKRGKPRSIETRAKIIATKRVKSNPGLDWTIEYNKALLELQNKLS